MSVHQQILNYLLELERALRAAGRWQAQAPPLAALQSTQPFACDTLAFEQWLQFIFLPKMRELISQRAPLPANIAVLPMAELSLPEENDIQHIIGLIDEVVSESC